VECLEDSGGKPWKTLLAKAFEAILRRKNAGKIAVVSAYPGEFHTYQFVIDCLIASFWLFVAFFVPPVDAQLCVPETGASLCKAKCVRVSL
jgi:hypothetical protein